LPTDVIGAKKDKTRLTIGFTVNATGTDRWEPLYIGHAAKPRAFKGRTGQQLHFFYLHNKRAWMTGPFFELYLRRFNSYIGRTKIRKVLLIIDNAPSHIYDHLNLAFLEVHHLPPNTTSVLQPSDAGIISSFKCHYRHLQLEHALRQIELGASGDQPYKVDQLVAMRWIRRSWAAINPSVFANCWRRSTLLEIEPSLALAADDAMTESEMQGHEELAAIISALPIENPMSIANFLNPIEEQTTNEYFTDEELVALLQQNPDDETESSTEDSQDTPLPLTEQFPKTEQINFMSVVISILEERLPGDTFTHSDLRHIQAALRTEVREE
jgi:hypothetical protein